MSKFFDWLDDKDIVQTTVLNIRDDLQAAHAKAHIARQEYQVCLELMETAGLREAEAEAEVKRLEKLLEAIK